MAAHITSASTAPARLYRYRVTVQLAEGRYETTRCAKHPMDAGMAVLKKLGFDEGDPHHPPLALFVVPVAAAGGADIDELRSVVGGVQ